MALTPLESRKSRLCKASQLSHLLLCLDSGITPGLQLWCVLGNRWRGTARQRVLQWMLLGDAIPFQPMHVCHDDTQHTRSHHSLSCGSHTARDGGTRRCSPVAEADLPMSQTAVYTEHQIVFDNRSMLRSALPGVTGGQRAGQGCHESWS